MNWFEKIKQSSLDGMALLLDEFAETKCGSVDLDFCLQQDGCVGCLKHFLGTQVPEGE